MVIRHDLAVKWKSFRGLELADNSFLSNLRRNPNSYTIQDECIFIKFQGLLRILISSPCLQPGCLLRKERYLFSDTHTCSL